MMEDLISKVLEFGMGEVIDKSRDPLLVNDEVYKQDCADLADLEERYEALELDKHDRMIINDYIACMNSSMCSVELMIFLILQELEIHCLS